VSGSSFEFFLLKDNETRQQKYTATGKIGTTTALSTTVTIMSRIIITILSQHKQKDLPFTDRIGCCGLDWSGLGQVQVESSCERGN
jgi:hypothetical protein